MKIRQGIIASAAITVFLVITSGFTTAVRLNTASKKATSSYSHFHYTYNSPGQQQGNCYVWMQAVVEFDWTPGTYPTNVVIVSATVYTSCETSYEVRLDYAWNTNAHIITMDHDRSNTTVETFFGDYKLVQKMISDQNILVDNQK